MNSQELELRLKRAEIVLDLVGNIFQDSMRLLNKSGLLKLTGKHEQIASAAFAIYQKLYFDDSLFANQADIIDELKALFAADSEIPSSVLAGAYKMMEELYKS